MTKKVTNHKTMSINMYTFEVMKLIKEEKFLRVYKYLKKIAGQL